MRTSTVRLCTVVALVVAVLAISADAEAGRKRRKRRKKPKPPAAAVQPDADAAGADDAGAADATADEGGQAAAGEAAPADGGEGGGETTQPASAPAPAAGEAAAGEVIIAAPAAEGAGGGPQPAAAVTAEAAVTPGEVSMALQVSGAVGLLMPMQGFYPVPALKVRGEVHALRMTLTDRVTLRGGAALGISLGGRSDKVDPTGQVAVDQIAFTFDIVPTALVEVAILDQIALHARVGLGMVVIQNELKVGFTAGGQAGNAGLSSTNPSGVLRLAAGGSYRVDDALQVTADVMAMDLVFWEHGSGSLFLLLVGATYAI